jgi:hypothetical protein
MTISNPISKTALRLLLPVTIAVLAGCQAPPPRVGVSSPPPPRFGSAPVAAYDDYALVLRPQVGVPRAERAVFVTTR